MGGTFEPLTSDINPLPGDYLKYFDRWGDPVGCGVVIKHVINARKPLTESYYVLKNVQKNKTWKVRCDQYDFMLMRHRTRNDNLSDYLREFISREENEV